REINDARRDKKWRNLSRTTFEKCLMFTLDDGEPANAGTDKHSGSLSDLGSDRQPRLLHRIVRRGNGVMDEKVHLLDVFLFKPAERIEVLNFSGDFGRK